MKETLYAIGDIHGMFGVISRKIERSHITDTHFVHVGDFGIGFYDSEFDKLKNLDKILIERNCFLYVIRGNHDSPWMFMENAMWENGMTHEEAFMNIRILEDYTVLDVGGFNILCVGGAISIDRKVRVTGESYWPGENFKLDKDKLETYADIDYVVTHTCPDFAAPVEWTPIVYSYADSDPGLHHELAAERRDVTEMHDILIKKNNIQKWFYGHFHFSKSEKIGDITFELLSINEFKKIF